MENWQQEEKYFDASMVFSAQEINASNLRRALLRFPLITVKIVAAIYWQALKLWLKKTPVYDHPDKLIQQSLNQTKVD